MDLASFLAIVQLVMDAIFHIYDICHRNKQ